MKLIGYWRSKEELNWPDPAGFVDNQMTPSEKALIIDYLKKGLFMPYASAGRSWCRFRCQESLLGTGEQTDGYFLWPEDLWHYVDKHNVRLPDEFIDRIREGNDMPRSIDDKFEISTSWWLNQKGPNVNNSSFLTMDSEGIIRLTFEEDLSIAKKLSFMKKLEAFKNKSLSDFP